MGRLLAGLLSLVGWFCVATVLALAGGIGYLWSAGHLDREKISGMIAIAQGLQPAHPPVTSDGDATEDVDQPALEDFVLARAIKTRDLELREQQLTNNIADLKSKQAKLFDEDDRYQRMKSAFKAELESLKEGALAEGQEHARLILENLKPKQAKEQLMLMIERQEEAAVVSLLNAMPVAKRAKILNEFKVDKETEAMSQILKLIRDGVPQVPLVDKQLQAVDDAIQSEPEEQ